MTEYKDSFDSNDIDNKVEIILRQTNYSKEVAREKLINANYDHLFVIKDYFGIPQNKKSEIKSINQEIYKQIRHKLDESLREYNNKNPININQLIENLTESENKEFNK